MRTRTQSEKKTDPEATPPPRKSKAGDVADAAKPNGKDQRADAKASEDEQPFFEYLASLGNRWSSGNLKLYIYRLWPELDLGEKHYIGIVREAVDEEFIARRFGSGKYMLLLKRPPHKPLMHNISVHDPQRPPNLDAALVVRNPVNDSYFKTWGAKPNGAAGESQKEPQAPQTQTDVNAILNTVLDKSGKFDPKLADLWERTAKERDELSKALAEKNVPPDALAILKQMKELFPEPAKAPEKSDTLALIAAIKGLQQDPLTVLKQARELFAPAGSPAHQQSGSDEIDRLDKVLGFAQKLAGLRIPGGGDRSGWELALEAGKDIGLPLAQMIGNLIALRTTGKPAASSVAGSPATAAAMPEAFNPYERPDLMQAHSRAMNAQVQAAASASPASAFPRQAPPGQPANSAPIITPPPGNSELLALLQNYGGLVVGALNNNMPGYNFAASLTHLVGTGTHAMICSHGQDALLQAMFSIPEIAMFGEMRVKRFVHEFVNYESYQDETEDEERDAVETAASAA